MAKVKKRTSGPRARQHHPYATRSTVKTEPAGKGPTVKMEPASEERPNFASTPSTSSDGCPTVPNPPGFSDMITTLDAVRGMDARMAEMETRLGAKIVGVELSLEGLRQEMEVGFANAYTVMTTLHKNSQARLLNSQLFRDPGTPLQALYHPRTGEPIANFPATVVDIDAFSSCTLNQLLAALDIDFDPRSTEEYKRGLFKRAIGVLTEIRFSF